MKRLLIIPLFAILTPWIIKYLALNVEATGIATFEQAKDTILVIYMFGSIFAIFPMIIWIIEGFNKR